MRESQMRVYAVIGLFVSIAVLLTLGYFDIIPFVVSVLLVISVTIAGYYLLGALKPRP